MSLPAMRPYYYLENFESMLRALLRRDADLLSTEEQEFIDRFQRLPLTSRALLVRMLMRKGPLFRRSRLVYSEIPDIDGAIGPVAALHWVDDDPALALAEAFQLYSKAELSTRLGWSAARRREPKLALLASLGAAATEERPLHGWWQDTERVIRLRVQSLCERLWSMFFGNFRQDLTEFVLADLGVFRYETPAIEGGSRPFSNRRQVEEFHQLQRCRDMLERGGDLDQIATALPPVIVDCDWLEERRQKLRFYLGRDYERRGERDRALGMYDNCSHAKASERTQRLREHPSRRQRHREAAATAIPAFELCLARSSSDAAVEYEVCDALAAAEADTQVRYVENGLVNSLFGLLCWPAIFAPLPGAFFHAFHRGPVDLSSAGFCRRRQREFDVCLAELQGESYKHTILERCAEKFGIASPFVAWDLIDAVLVRMALACIPATHLALLFEWMMRDLRTHRSGFPDLVQFYPASPRYRLIEVKGPGDRLQDNQRRCLEFLASHGVPVSVCHVRWRNGQAAVG